MTKQIHDLEVVGIRTLKQGFHVITLWAPESLPQILPGQFAEIAPPGHEVFLRRPFSFYDIDFQANTLSFLFKAVGKGTKAMAAAKPGDFLNTIYPLGKSYTLPTGNKALLAGGGTGIAPMLMLGKFLISNGITPTFIFGGRSKDDIVDLDIFQKLGEVMVATEDGSLGFQGLITRHPVFASLKDFSKIYSCGPDPMMHAIGILAQEAGVACEVSLENTMACGIGACLCCIVETHEGNLTTCTSGPVFNVVDLVGWDQPKL
ncbi:MAG: dihydroorotate dehydrogenase electron transfer subunit [Bacteroidota bacterium]